MSKHCSVIALTEATFMSESKICDLMLIYLGHIQEGSPTYDFAEFLQKKLHEIAKILGRRWGGGVGGLRSATATCYLQCLFNIESMAIVFQIQNDADSHFSKNGLK